jgi:hypothetical protein
VRKTKKTKKTTTLFVSDGNGSNPIPHLLQKKTEPATTYLSHKEQKEYERGWVAVLADRVGANSNDS